MTVLATTPDHLAEFEFGQLTITRRTDGRALAFTGSRVAGEFRDCLKTAAPARVIGTYLRMFSGQEWGPMYKPDAIAAAKDSALVAALADEFAARLRAYLGADKFAEVRRLNATPAYGGGCCASHDFCDANMIMFEAFEAIADRGHDPASQPDSDLWNAAWNDAAARHLTRSDQRFRNAEADYTASGQP